MNIVLLWSVVSIVSCGLTDSYYYEDKQSIQLAVGSLNSIQALVPFRYQYLQICPSDKFNYTNDNIGEIISGQRTSYTNYMLNINQNDKCKVYCEKNITQSDIVNFSWLIRRNYLIQWYLDFLPAGLIVTEPKTNKSKATYNSDIPIGYEASDKSIYIYNHYSIHVDIHKQDNKYQIVGFNIKPYSIHKELFDNCSKTEGAIEKAMEGGEKLYMKLPESISEETEEQIIFSYDVTFHMSNVTFASRWDHYWYLNSEIHWIGLINSNILIGVITFIVVFIFYRALKKDIDIYNEKVTLDDFIDEYGWKQVCYDVFRKPKHSMILSALIGTGIQLLIMIFYVLTFSVLGFLKPESRGNLITIMLFVFVFTGTIEGYVSNWIYRLLGGREWLKCTMLTSFLFPSFALLVLCLVNIMFSFEKSSAVVSFKDILSLFFLWICCCTPLVFLGSFLGINRKLIKYPCKVNPLPSTVPSKPWYFHIKYGSLILGLIPFAATFIEFIYIMQSLWRHQVLILAWFLYVAVVFLIITCAEISILFVYLNLCKGDHNWWWKSFFIAASPCIYFAFYSIYYFFYLNITRVSAMIVYFALMSLITTVLFLICGSAGIILTFCFMMKIYSMIKID